MKITCCIDHLGPGGAQRQISLLANLLVQRDHKVTLLTYHDNSHFASQLHNRVEVRSIQTNTWIERMLRFRSFLRKSKSDVVITFLRTPSLLAELAAWPNPPFKLIVSERNLYPNEFFLWRKLRLFLHRLANAVVTNSPIVLEQLIKEAPALAGKSSCIKNGVDLEEFEAAPLKETETITLLFLGKYRFQKNPQLLVEAAASFLADHPKEKIKIHFYGENYFDNGAPTALSATYFDTQRLIDLCGLGDTIKLHGPSSDVTFLLQNATALVLPSRYEGMANVLCEALACGCPPIVSSEAINDGLIRDGENGYIFTSNSAEDLKRTISRLVDSTAKQREQMRLEARKSAEEHLAADKYVEAYLKLMKEL